MNNTTYDRLKDVNNLGLPAAGALYFGLAEIWGLPASAQVTGTVTLLVTFFGVLLKIAQTKYNNSDRPFDGDMLVEPNERGGITYGLNLNVDPADLADKSRVVFKVVPTPIAENEEFWGERDHPGDVVN